MRRQTPTNSQPALSQALTLITITLLLLIPAPSSACPHHNPYRHAFDANAYISSITTKQDGNAPHTNDSGGNLTVGIIAGITLGSVALIIAIVLIMLCLSRRCAQREVEDYQGFAEWRKDRHLTSVDITRRGPGKGVPAYPVPANTPNSPMSNASDPNSPSHV